jgi:inosine-uridine nucleoside N-ribohydrolase
MRLTALLSIALLLLASCVSMKEKKTEKLRVLFDTDANNELDDQHALAYLLLNRAVFDVAGITVNATRGGGNIDNHYAEAERVMKLCGTGNKIPLYKGANTNFDSIRQHISEPDFDGHDAVDFIIAEARKATGKKLVLLPVGKLTNVALALEKEPAIEKNLRVVWLGSNFPDPGEYNLDNDTSSLNYVLKTNVEFEMVTVSYGRPTGTDVVRATQEEINTRMPGKGPHITTPVTGRHGGSFTSFGDYSVSLFEHIDYHGNPPSRALFDMAAVAIVKDPSWATKREVPAYLYINNQWVERPGSSRKITVWENFNRDKIMQDFYSTLEQK